MASSYPQASTSVVTLSYHDLVDFNLHNPDSALVDCIAQAFGTEGLGILAVRDMPNFESQRQALLPLAAQLPSLSDIHACECPESFYSIGWSHGKEKLGGKPDFAKGSFYADPLVEEASDEERYPDSKQKNLWPQSIDLKTPFLEMSKLIAETGRLLAAVCDAYCRQHGVDIQLEDLLVRSTNAKGRLLHYFDVDVDALPSTNDDSNNQLWCGWHNDHGALTGLVPALFLNDKGESVDGDDSAGLYIQARSGDVVRVKLPSNACAFQIGETAQILSGGLLQATPHAVRIGSSRGITRETFALFLQPNLQEPLNIPHGKTIEQCQGAHVLPLLEGVVPLNKRWKPKHTFGDFHNATLAAFSITRTGGL